MSATSAPTVITPPPPTEPAASASPSAVTSASSDAPPLASVSANPLVITLPKRFATTDFSSRPFVFTGAFDGSLRFSLWLRTLRFARKMQREHGKPAHFTYFVNACFFSTRPGPSDIGRAMSQDEVLVRRALAQIAINEGHDLGNHGVGHQDGRSWTKEEWLAELDRFHAILDGALFRPVRDERGVPVFPRFEPLADAAPGAFGAACQADSDCTSGSCAELTPEGGLCTQPCNLKQKCPSGSACGAPMFRTDTDVCIPLPSYPIEEGGQVLFDARGQPNWKHPKLRSYPIVGFRAPYLAANDALYEALATRGYIYDTSQSASPSPPYFLETSSPPPATRTGPERRGVLELALMLHPGALTIPMDYNYEQLGASGARMEADYEAAILSSYRAGRIPFNVGHHFAPWEEGAYLTALERTVDRTLRGCPDDRGEERCPGATALSFRELAKVVTGDPRLE